MRYLFLIFLLFLSLPLSLSAQGNLVPVNLEWDWADSMEPGDFFDVTLYDDSLNFINSRDANEPNIIFNLAAEQKYCFTIQVMDTDGHSKSDISEPYCFETTKPSEVIKDLPVAPYLLTLDKIFEKPIVKSISGTATTVGVLAGVLGSAVAALFTNPMSFSELFLLPLRLWGALLLFLGIRKRAKQWGTVYDAVTKQPLDPAVVMLFDASGKSITEAITDLDGRYGFLVETGGYVLVGNKTDYKFPSDKLKGKTFDELYQDLYFGEPIEVKGSGEVIAKNIPLDPLKFNWNEFAKNEQKLMKFYSRRDLWLARISDFLFTIGFIVAIVAMLAAPRPYNYIIVLLYIFIYFLRRLHLLKPKHHGVLIDKNTGLPIAFAVIRVFLATTNTQIIKKVTNKLGKYLILVPNGKYYVKIDRKNPDETYATIYQSEPFEVKKGVIDKKFEI